MLDTARANAERGLETCVPGIHNGDDDGIRQFPDGLCNIDDKHHEYANVHDPKQAPRVTFSSLVAVCFVYSGNRKWHHPKCNCFKPILYVDMIQRHRHITDFM